MGLNKHEWYLVLLDVRSLAVASRSRQSEKQPVVDELALI